jgi:class 3 adenylate cyclase
MNSFEEYMLGAAADVRAKDEPPIVPRLSWTGTFVDPKVEAEFHVERAATLRRSLRFSLLLASSVFLAYGVHDAFVVPHVRERAWAVRYALFLPLAAAVFWGINSGRLLRFVQPAVFSYGIAASFVVLYIGAIAGGYGFYLYTSYAVLFVTLGPFVARMSVITQTVYTLSSIALYNVLDVALTGSPFVVLISMNMTLLALGGIGALLAYQLEINERQGFWQHRVIRDQVRQLAEEKSRSEELLLNVLPPSIAERLKAKDRPIADGFANVSVLFADIVGFTKMSERVTPSELVERLNLMFSSFDDLADKLKLEKIKTIGDAYMVAGGLHSHEYDHALAIAEMALAMRRRAETFSSQFGEVLDIRIGIHTGPVVAGVIGKRKFIYDVWGDTVNTASRMESHAEPGTIQVTEAVYMLLKDMYELDPRGEIEIKGKGKMRTWYLQNPAGVGSEGKTRMPRRIA